MKDMRTRSARTVRSRRNTWLRYVLAFIFAAGVLRASVLGSRAGLHFFSCQFLASAQAIVVRIRPSCTSLKFAHFGQDSHLGEGLKSDYPGD